jgi:hypothetical protein
LLIGFELLSEIHNCHVAKNILHRRCSTLAFLSLPQPCRLARFSALLTCWLLTFVPQGLSAATSTTVSLTSPTSSPIAPSTAATLTFSSPVSSATPPDVLLNVPTLSVGRIDLDVDNLQADINLNANVASLVSINAGVAVSIQHVNLTIVDVEAQLELIVRLGHLVDIVNRVFQSLDLNPLLITALNSVSSVLQPVVGAVDGLLGSVAQGGTTLSFLVDNLGNIVQEVTGANGSPVSSIVGNYLTNMTYTSASEVTKVSLYILTLSWLIKESVARPHSLSHHYLRACKPCRLRAIFCVLGWSFPTAFSYPRNARRYISSASAILPWAA